MTNPKTINEIINIIKKQKTRASFIASKITLNPEIFNTINPFFHELLIDLLENRAFGKKKRKVYKKYLLE